MYLWAIVVDLESIRFNTVSCIRSVSLGDGIDMSNIIILFM